MPDMQKMIILFLEKNKEEINNLFFLNSSDRIKTPEDFSAFSLIDMTYFLHQNKEKDYDTLFLNLKEYLSRWSDSLMNSFFSIPFFSKQIFSILYFGQILLIFLKYFTEKEALDILRNIDIAEIKKNWMHILYFIMLFLVELFKAYPLVSRFVLQSKLIDQKDLNTLFGKLDSNIIEKNGYHCFK